MLASARSLPALLPLVVAGCRHPPDAPASLDDLSGYLFEHYDDPEAMEAGLANLRAWLLEGDHLEATLEGYTVSNLSQAAVSDLDDRDRVLEDLHGAAVGTEGEPAVADVVRVLVDVDPVDLSPGTYESYDRDFLDDPDCFLAGECDTLAVFNTMVSRYLGGTVVIETQTHGRYRWVDTEAGPAMVQRTWLEAPADVSLDWLDVDEQFYLNVVMPGEAGGSLRLQAMWVVARLGDSSVPEDMALQIVIESMQGVYEDVDGWIADHGAEGAPPRQGCAAVGGGGAWGAFLALVAVARRRGGRAQG